MKLKNWMWVAIPALIIAACKNKSSDEAKRTVFFDKTGMDTTVSPGENFFLYANGGWIKNTKIPASETRWGSFNILIDNNEKNLHKILDDVSSKDSYSDSN